MIDPGEWKTLANAIVHNDYDPHARLTYIGCEKCKNPALHVIYTQSIDMPECTRVTLNIYECPECGHKELDCIGTYPLKEFTSNEVLSFAGHYVRVWLEVMKMTGTVRDKHD